MRKLACSIISLSVFLSCVSVSFAQIKQETNSQPTALTISAFAASERVRFTAPASVVQMRLEVYDAAGRKLFDNELRGGNVLDWHLQDGQAGRLADDTYLCVVTVKQRSGRLTQRLGAVRIEQNNINVQAATAPQLTAQQSAAIGPVEEYAALSVLKEDETQTTTVIAHNGEEGQLVRGRGALSFRLGDFYSGKDSEQMRLTVDGKLGLGVTDPQAKLDVAGAIRTSEGIVFPDGSVQTTAYVASGRSLSERVSMQRDVQGRSSIEAAKPGGAQQQVRLAPESTPGRLAKFGGDGVTPVDTQVSESNGALLVGNAGATGNIQIFGQANADVFAGMGPDVVNGPAFNYGYAGSSFGRSAGFFNVRPDASAVAPNPSLRFLTANQQRMIITNTGNVGIGEPNPAGKLEVHAQDALRLAGFQPFLTLIDVDGGTGRASRIQTANNSLSLLVADAGFTLRERLKIDINGNVGIGTPSPGSRLHVLSSATGVLGETTAANATQPGVLGRSTGNGGVGVTGEATTGVYGNTTSNSGIGVTGQATTSSGIGVYGTGTSATGYGVFANNPTGMALGVAGNAAQNREKGGLVKAMIYVGANGNILRCYNSQRQDGGAGSPPTVNTGCGFSVSPILGYGVYDIDFGFQVNDRFASAMPQWAQPVSIGLMFNFYPGVPNKITIFTFITDVDNIDSQTDNGFMLIIY